jgi:hypothetical protein
MQTPRPGHPPGVSPVSSVKLNATGPGESVHFAHVLSVPQLLTVAVPSPGVAEEHVHFW